jgi:hypothetical protein
MRTARVSWRRHWPLPYRPRPLPAGATFAGVVASMGERDDDLSAAEELPVVPHDHRAEGDA